MSAGQFFQASALSGPGGNVAALSARTICHAFRRQRHRFGGGSGSRDEAIIAKDRQRSWAPPKALELAANLNARAAKHHHNSMALFAFALWLRIWRVYRLCV